MRERLRPLLLASLLAGAAVALLLPGCDNVETKDPAAGGDDDDDGSTATPTPTASGTPTGTPTPAPGLVGDPWTATATPAEQGCAFGAFLVQFGNAGTSVIGIATTGSDLHFDIGLHLDPAIAIAEEPNGTVDGNGDFTQSFAYCTFNGLSTIKYAGTWTGTFDGGMTTFDSTLTEQLYVENGDLRAMCASVSTPFGDCTSPGVSFAVHGVKQ